MDIPDARAFLAANHRAVLATFRSDGRPQLSPVAVGVDSAGRAVISSRQTAYKVQNLRRDPRASLCVLSDGFYGPWAQVEGTATVVSLPDAMELLVDYYRSLAGEHPDWDDYRSAMRTQGKALIRLTPRHWSPVATGGFPAHLVGD
jgi:PPOX class probable F420-dependent enzyme